MRTTLHPSSCLSAAAFLRSASAKYGILKGRQHAGVLRVHQALFSGSDNTIIQTIVWRKSVRIRLKEINRSRKREEEKFKADVKAAKAAKPASSRTTARSASRPASTKPATTARPAAPKPVATAAAKPVAPKAVKPKAAPVAETKSTDTTASATASESKE